MDVSLNNIHLWENWNWMHVMFFSLWDYSSSDGKFIRHVVWNFAYAILRDVFKIFESSLV